MKISSHVYQIDVKPLGYERQIAVYLVVGDDYSLLIDTGPRCSLETLYSELEKIIYPKELKYIALTHIHLDHGGGATSLVRRIGTNTRILVHPRGVKHLIDPSKLWDAAIRVLGREVAELQGRPEPISSEYVKGIDDYENIDIGGVVVKAIHTPGHAPHHVVYIVHPDNIAVTGDAVATYYDGRLHPVSPPPFKTELALKSIDKIIAEKPDKVAVSHFGLALESGIQILERAKRKIIEWKNFIEEQVRKGIQDPDKIYKMLLEVDEETMYIVKVRENNPLFRGSAYKSLLGIYYDIVGKVK